jgi:putative spermidine/putrescine transport system permease protein
MMMAGRGMNWPRCLLWLCSIPVMAYLLMPLLIVVPISFSSGAYLQFPPPSYSLQWYRSYFQDPQWVDATWLSVEVALTAAALAVILGGLAAVALVRMPVPFRPAIRIILLLPMIIPSIVVAISVYSLYARLHLVATFVGIVLAHTVLALPFAATMLMSGFQQLNRSLEEVSFTMGGSAWYTLRRVTLPMLQSSIVAAAVFSFMTSWDEVIMVIFIGGGDATTLPLKMFSYLRTEINPTIAAVSTLLLTAVGISFAALELMRPRLTRPEN